VKSILLIIVCLAVLSVRATIMAVNKQAFDFTNPAVAITNATWSDTNLFSVTTNGLGWSGGGKGVYAHSLWFVAAPLAIGTSWRPATSASFNFEVVPPIKPVTLAEGDSWTPQQGRVFVRYSPDRQHWSTWQYLDGPEFLKSESASNVLYHGQIEIPQIEMRPYEDLLLQYRRQDVPWADDEAAAVRWILRQQPDFFDHQLPFAGYVQFRFEAALPHDQRIQRMRMRVTWSVGGLSSEPAIPGADTNRNGAWDFQAR